jgi:hypothetical protein
VAVKKISWKKPQNEHIIELQFGPTKIKNPNDVTKMLYRAKSRETSGA